MQRENRYLVLKRTDLEAAELSGAELETLRSIAGKVDQARSARGKAPLECVVVESDWPEYLDTWSALAQRVDGVGMGQARMQQFQDYEQESPNDMT